MISSRPNSTTKQLILSCTILLLCLEEIAQEDKAEAGSKASGLANIFTKFDTFCGLQIGALVFQQAEQLSRLLQKKSLVASAAKAAAQILISSVTYTQGLGS